MHEYGHLTGHQHSADGPDVMSPIYRAPLPACLIADPSTPPAAAPAAVAPPTPTPTPAAPASVVLDVPTAQKAIKRPKARATGRKTRAKSRAKARAASVPLQHFSDADAELTLPWQPFAEEE